MRQLIERNDDYHESLIKLKTECIKSNFNRKLTENQFLEIQKNKEISNNPSKKKYLLVFSVQEIIKVHKRRSKTFPSR